MLDKILDKREAEAVERFANDEVALRAVKKVLLTGLYNNGALRPGFDANPTHNFALTSLIQAVANGKEIDNEAVGQDLRSCAMGIYLLENAWREMEKLKKVEAEVKEKKQRGK
jgi:hypothetical protein